MNAVAAAETLSKLGTMSKPELLEDLQVAFPDWVIWRSSGGLPWATRRRRLSRRELYYGLNATISAADVEELVQKLRQEETIERRLQAPEGHP